jgi:hypothetical protein
MALFEVCLSTLIPLGPIARGGYVFLPQSNVSVRIQQIQLEQVPSTFLAFMPSYDSGLLGYRKVND